MSSGESLMEAVKGFCREEGISFHREDNERLLTGFTGTNGTFMAIICVQDNLRQLMVLTSNPVRGPANRKAEIMEILTRINLNLGLGNYEYHFDKGDIICKTAVKFGPAVVDKSIIKHTFFANWYCVDKYFPAINAVVSGHLSVADALDLVQEHKPKGKSTTGGGPCPSSLPKVDVGGRIRNLLEGSN